MKRIVLTVLILISAFSLFYFGFELTKQNELAYSPQMIFNETDKKIIRVNRLSEFKNSNEFTESNNILVSELLNFQQEDLYRIGVYISINRPILLFEKKGGWLKSEVQEFANRIKLAGTEIEYKGDFLLIAANNAQNEFPLTDFNFNNGDIKASYIVWEFKDNWIKTDVYNIQKGFFEYRTIASSSNFGNAVDDVSLFSSVLPENIVSYTFNSRFYAEFNDSIYKLSPMSKWIDKGFVEGYYNDEKFIITDNRPKQTPSLLLIEANKNNDDADYSSEIKFFKNIKLTSSFPKGDVFYLAEIEDKTVLTENKALAENIVLNYSLGETLALNESKKEQFFKGLPSASHYRMVNEEEKRSKTWKNAIVFEVATLPPGDSLILTETKNWNLKPSFSKIIGMTPIKDHIRGGASLFVYDDKGNYELINQSGQSVYKGSIDSKIIGEVQVIDIFENDKMQLLFKTKNKIYALALNGEMVSGFPYNSDHEITSEINHFRWSNTFRCLFGNEKGEITMINQKGGELNVVQASSNIIKQNVFALNVNGNLRAWFIDDNNNTGLAYLETPAKPEILSKNSATHHVKKGSEVFSFQQNENKIFKYISGTPNYKVFCEGQLLQISSDQVITKSNNNILFFDLNGDLIATQKVSFNEVGGAHRIMNNSKQLIGVYDYLENNYYLYDESGDLIEGFPKETRKTVEVHIDSKNKLFNLFTIINGNVVCYKHFFAV